MSIPKLFSRYFFIIAVVNVLVGIGLQFFNATTTLYIQSLGGTAGFAGFCLTMLTVAAMVMRIFSGRLTDTRGRRIIIVSGLIVFCIASASFNLFPFLGVLPILRFLQGAGYSMATTALSVAITDVIPKQRMGEGIGYYGLGQNITQAIGPALAMGFIFGDEYKFVFYAATGFLFICIITMFFCGYEKDAEFIERQQMAPHDNKPMGKSPQFGIAAFFEKSALPCTVIQIFISLTMGATIAFLMAYAVNIGIGNPGLYFTLSAICMVLVRVSSGRFTDRFQPVYILVPGLLINIGAFVCLLFASQNHSFFYVAGVFAGIAGGITGPVLQANVARMAPDKRRGTAMATFMVAMDIGIGIGGILWGSIIDYSGYSTMYVGCIISLLIAILLSVLLLRKE